jgi:cold shock CspA family protein
MGDCFIFHRNSVLSDDFAALKRGDEVSYVEDTGDTGPVAVKVRVKPCATPAAAASDET